jgi:outer membrane protein assembly factor BamB
MLTLFQRKKTIVKFLSLAFMVTACDSFSKKDPLPGKRESYIDFGGLDLHVDASLKGKKPFIPTKKPRTHTTQALVNDDESHAPAQLLIKEEPTWTLSIGSGQTRDRLFFGHPVSDGDLLFVSDTEGKISAIRDHVKEGRAEILWTFESIPDGARDNIGCATLAVDGETLVVASAIGDVIALDKRKGTMLWKTSLNAPIRVMPAVKDGRVFVSSIDGRTTALDLQKGSILWTQQGFTELSSIQGGASPVVKDDLVVASCSSGEVFVMRADNETPLWSDTITTALRSDSISSIPHIVGNPIVEKSILYAVSHGGRTAAFDLSSGTTSWQADVGSLVSPLLIGNALFIVDNNNRVICLEKETGKIYWVTPLPLSAEGKPLLWTAPIAVNEQLLTCSSLGDIMYLNLSDGSKYKRLTTKDGFSTQPIVIRDHLYLLTESGQLIKY